MNSLQVFRELAQDEQGMLPFNDHHNRRFPFLRTFTETMVPHVKAPAVHGMFNRILQQTHPMAESPVKTQECDHVGIICNHSLRCRQS
jgi:hypothetical protein